MTDTLSRYETLLSSVKHLPVPLGRAASLATTVMTDYGIASYDAIHAASAIVAGAGAICPPGVKLALHMQPTLECKGRK